MPQEHVHIIGGGLAGCEAAQFLANNGVNVIIHEMRPGKTTGAHKTNRLAELVCSNSLKSALPVSAPGILKSEMKEMGSLVLSAAARSSVPAGQALAVDREIFSEIITRAILEHPSITCITNEEISQPFEQDYTLIATGPLTSESLASWISKNTADDLYFYDAIAPIIDASTIDMNNAFIANRRDAYGEAAYINCPMTDEEYNAFVDFLDSAEKVQARKFEKEKFFQACQPIEAISATGRDSLRYGPMKPVGLENPRTGKMPYAVVQLRPENQSLSSYNMVGFQTKLTHAEQKKAFRMIPALKNAEFLRLGSIHRNTYICSPKTLRPDLSFKGHPKIYIAGQITGVEGYVESAACGLLAAVFILQRIKNIPHNPPPANTAMGALLRYLLASDPKNFQPTGMHFGLFEPAFFEGLAGKNRDDTRTAMVEQAQGNFKKWKSSNI